jgi:arginine repressor
MDFDSAFCKAFFAMTMVIMTMGKMAAALAALPHHDDMNDRIVVLLAGNSSILVMCVSD